MEKKPDECDFFSLSSLNENIFGDTESPPKKEQINNIENSILNGIKIKLKYFHSKNIWPTTLSIIEFLITHNTKKYLKKEIIESLSNEYKKDKNKFLNISKKPFSSLDSLKCSINSSIRNKCFKLEKKNGQCYILLNFNIVTEYLEKLYEDNSANNDNSKNNKQKNKYKLNEIGFLSTGKLISSKRKRVNSNVYNEYNTSSKNKKKSFNKLKHDQLKIDNVPENFDFKTNLVSLNNIKEKNRIFNKDFIKNSRDNSDKSDNLIINIMNKMENSNKFIDENFEYIENIKSYLKKRKNYLDDFEKVKIDIMSLKNNLTNIINDNEQQLKNVSMIKNQNFRIQFGEMKTSIKKSLDNSKAKIENLECYIKNLQNYANKIIGLNADIVTAINNIPNNKEQLINSYLENFYNDFSKLEYCLIDEIDNIENTYKLNLIKNKSDYINKFYKDIMEKWMILNNEYQNIYQINNDNKINMC